MIVGNKIILREKRLTDAWNDYLWESDPELAQLDAAPMINFTFQRYLADFANELDNCPPTSRRFSVETLEGKHIGNCSFYDISETKSQAELGIMIGDRDYWDRGYGTSTVTAMVDHIFRETSIDRIYLKTLLSNDRAQKCFQRCGFTTYGHLDKDGFSFILMELHRHQWSEQPTNT